MKNNLTLGSLFDGSGGFPLGGWISGITPLWSSEIEPFPIRVTTKRFPNMKHYGDVSKLNGAELPPVDIITFGSPCQDMSIAGKRAGLDGNRSSLFHEAIRIIKEMRGATNEKYPRYIVWENVPGAFSSNKGKDFKAVIESICSIKADSVFIPEPPKGKWTGAGHVDVATGFDIAWRTVDAQYWGVPQRRKRIYLVADFANGCAGKILFESEGLSGYSAESFRAWQRAAGASAEGSGETGSYSVDGYNSSVDEVAATLGVNYGVSTGRNGVMVLNDQGGNRMDVTEDMTCTLRAEAHHPPCVLEAAGFCTEHSADARSIEYEEERSPTLRAGVVPAAIVLENHPADSRVKISEDGKVQTLTSRCGTGGGNVPLVMEDVEKSMETTVIALQGNMIGRADKNGPQGDGVNENICFTLNATDRHAVCTPTPQEVNYIVRRLTPTECARLQGFPYWWCDDLATENPTQEEIEYWREVFETHRKAVGTSTKPKSEKQIIKWLKEPHTDSAEYKMWGNGVALPNVVFALSGIVWADSKIK